MPAIEERRSEVARLERFPGLCLTRDEIKEMVERGTKGFTAAQTVHVQNCTQCREWYEHLQSSAK